MKTTIQKTIKLVALSACFISCTPAFAKASEGGFFDKNEDCPCYVGIKATWRQLVKLRGYTDSTLEAVEDSCGGSIVLIGPFVEWKPLNGIGIQSGLSYSHTSLDMKNRELSGIGDGKGQFHALNIPLFVQLYPGSGRQFFIQLGLYYVIPFAAKQVNLIEAQNKEVVHNIDINNYVLPVAAIGYKMKCGLRMGIGSGLVLGYDFTKLFINKSNNESNNKSNNKSNNE